MKYALVNGERREAHPDLSGKGKCPACGSPMIAKCGEFKVDHWAHKSRGSCDRWWESETEWHRTWKNHFPENWQEVVHSGENGEKHIADVRTDEGWVIEFQHSYLKPEERRSRDKFYPKLVWVVDGTRRKNDRKQFANALKEAKQVGESPVLHIHWWDECRLLREWSGSDKFIFFDFGGDELCWLFQKMPNRTVYVALLYNTSFIKSHSEGDFEELVRHLKKLLKSYLQAQASKQIRLQPSQIRPQPRWVRRDPLEHLQQSQTRKGKRSYARKSKRGRSK